MIFGTLTRRLLLWFVMAGLLPLLALGYLALHYYEQTLRASTLQNIANLADKKALQIRGFWIERIADTRIIARSSVTRDALVHLPRSYQAASHESLHYQKTDAQYRDYFERYTEDAVMFYDVLLINLQGDIIYSQRRESDFATNLMTGTYRNSPLAEAFRESRMTFGSSASSYAYYPPSQAMAAFVVVPVVSAGKLLGSIALQLDIKHVYQLAVNPVGLGLSGETVLAKQVDQGHAMILSQTKSKLSGMPKATESSKISDPMRNALSGVRGQGIVAGYRGQQIVAAWRYLPDLRLGMVVKMDADEAFAPLRQQRILFLTALLSVALFVSAAAFYFGRRLVAPIRELAKGAEDVAQGNLARRVREIGEGEIALLGRAFNRMAGNLQSLYATLEQRVEQRTQELNSANERLQNEIIEREKIAAAAKLENDFRDEMINSLPGIFYMINPAGRFLLWNKNLERVLGCSSEEIWSSNALEFVTAEERTRIQQDIRQVFELGENAMEALLVSRNGTKTPYFFTGRRIDRNGEPVMVGLGMDIAAHKLAEEEIYRLAYYDTLTQLPNRRLLQDRFSQALAASERSRKYGAVLFLDLDKFKTLNDTLGHGYGDMLLIEAAGRIKACLRKVDIVARMGGDEFVVLIEAVSEDAKEATRKAAHVAEKIRVALLQPYMLEGHDHHGTTSIGVCLYQGLTEVVATLLKHADMALYQAKGSGRNRVCFFDPAMQQAVEKRAEMETDLRRAIASRQFSLYYQIQLDNESRPIGAEALLRWNHPTRGMVSPAEFIPLAEESRLIYGLGLWVLESACRQLERWRQYDLTRDLKLSINVSAQQFAMPDFVGQVASMLHTHSVNPANLKLELTESVVLENVQGAIETMHALKGLGVGLSMDDFGTGYSSLSYLKRLPLDQLKIDQSFVRDITTDPNDAVLVQAIIGMALNFRLNVIAEGVETQAQLIFLKQHGCMAYQGYLFGKPVPIEEFEASLART